MLQGTDLKHTIFSFFIFLFLNGLVLYACTNASIPNPSKIETEQSIKQSDLVLIHGLANKHQWSEDFLEACLEIWGSGRVFIVYTSPETHVAIKDVNGNSLIVAGDSANAGIDSIDTQVANLTNTIENLQNEYELDVPFSIIAHSMGGLISRKYIFDNPGKVAGLVTLGTPHQGSPLANSFSWIGQFLNATKAIEDLKPENVALFNKKYPIESNHLADTEKIYSIRGVPDAKDCFGWAGELQLGWHILSTVYDTPSDGLVPYNSAVINGVENIGDFPHLDHYGLVKQPAVVFKAAEYLP